MAIADLTAARLRELFSYDPDTGVFTRIKRAGKRGLVGEVPKLNIDRDGYAKMTVDGARHRQHRLVWLYVYGEHPKMVIDHINGIRTDNRISNLRDVPLEINRQNVRVAQRNNKSGLPGVRSSQGKWRAVINCGTKQTSLGRFGTPEEAHAAYVEAKRRLHPGYML